MPRGVSAAERQRLLAQAAQQRRRRWILVAVVALLAAVAIFGPMLVNRFRAGAAPTGTAASRDAGLQPVEVKEGQPLRFAKPGQPRHTVVLYEDAHCPHCIDFERSHSAVLYDAVAAGTVALEIWPMAFIDAGSGQAAAGLACAAEAGYGLTFHELLYANAKLAWSDEQLLSLSTRAHGATDPGFAGCLSSGLHRNFGAATTSAAQAAGITQTPTLLIDGAPVTIDSSLTPAALKAKLA